MDRILLSIVIPTKNRQKYCIAAIKQIISLNLNNIEVCIQDNSDTPDLKEAIEKLSNIYIKYQYHGEILSFVDNFSLAIEMASGEYVCMIGDDDGLLPNIMQVVDYAKSNNIDVVIPGLNVVYFWPSEKPIVRNGQKGYLSVSEFANTYSSVDPQKALKKLLKNGALNYIAYDMPKVYHGVVKRELFEIIKQKTGKYFDGLTPDIYMSAALSFVAQKVVSYRAPVTISGICPISGSSDSATGKHTGDLKNAPHFRGHESYEWEEIIPAFYSVETIWAETLIKAIHQFKQDHMLSFFSISVLDNECLKKYPQYTELIKKHAAKYDIALSCEGKYLYYNFKKLCMKIINRMLQYNTGVKKFYGVTDICQAASIVRTNCFHK